MSSYTPRRKDSKPELYGGLQLKTRAVEQEAPGRRLSFYQESEGYQSEARGLSKRRDSAAPAYASSKYIYDTRYEGEQEGKISEDSCLREIPRGNRELREQRARREQRDQKDQHVEPRDQYRDSKDQKDLNDRCNQEKPGQDKQYRKGSYLGNKRNQAILRESRKQWNVRDENNSRKQNQPQQAQNQPPKKAMDPQLVEKLYSISKLSSRISERLKSMTMALDKHRV